MFRNKLLVTLITAVALTGLGSISGVQAAATCPTKTCTATSCTIKTVPVKTIVKNINGKTIKVCVSKTNKKCKMKSTKKCAVKPVPVKPTAKPVPAPAPTKPAAKPTPAPAPAKPAPTPAPTNTQTSVSAFEKKVAELVNQERAKQGLKPLTLDTKLSDVARAKSQDMKDKNYFSHTSPTYGSPFDMMKKFGITYRAAGENIAKGQRTPEEVMNAWMNSDGHRKNILSPNFTHIGVGYVASGNIWTQMFIGK